MERPSKINYYLDIAQTVAKRTTCLRKMYGSIIVKNDVIISTGYVGAPRGRKNCSDIGTCRREEMGIQRGERYELCRSVHSEANAIVAASRSDMLDSTLYMACLDSKTGELIPDTTSCQMCKRLIINAGIAKVIVRDTPESYRAISVADWIINDDSMTNQLGY